MSRSNNGDWPVKNWSILFWSAALLVLFVTVAETAHDETLEEKMRDLKALAKQYSGRPIPLNGDNFKRFVRTAPRNYSTVVMFTALSPKMGCIICREIYDEFLAVIYSFSYDFQNEEKLFFVVIDFETGQDVFQSMGLSTAPIIRHFPAKGKPKKGEDNMDLQRYGFEAESIIQWVSERTSIPIRLRRPPNYAAIAKWIGAAFLVFGLLFWKRNNLLSIFNSRILWGIICLAIIFAFLSGQMWNKIKNPPLMSKGNSGHYGGIVHGSSQYQFVAETYFVYCLYAIITLGFIAMTESATLKGHPTKQRLLAFIGLAIVIVFFSLLNSVFRTKYGGYPYRLLFA